jgi:L-malate glycosyltransferase
MPRVLLTNFHPRGGGGHVPYIFSLIRHLHDAEHVFGVAAPEQSQVYRFLAETSYPFLYRCDFPAISHKRMGPVGQSLLRFREIVKDFRPDIVHTNGGDLYTVIWSHPLQRPFKIIRTHHAVRTIQNDFYHRLIYGNVVAWNIFVSESSLRLCASSGINLPNSMVIENGIDTDLFKPIPKDGSLAAKLGIEEEVFCFGSCAGTMPYKRVDTIIQAAAQLQGERRFAIIVLGDESFGAELKGLAADLGVPRFIYAGFHRNVIPYISLFDVGFVLSDSVETISFAAREMMAMGKPLISSSFSGLSENITDHLNGFLVEPGDVDGTAAAMKKFLDMKPEQLKEFSTKAREKAVGSFAIQRMIELHAALYSRILER